MNLSQRGPYGWSEDGRFHWVPGRLLVAVPGLLRNSRMASALAEQIGRQPGVVAVQANPLSGRVLIRFDAGQIDHRQLLAMAGAVEAEPGLPARHPSWAVSSVSPLGGRDVTQLVALACQQPDEARPAQVQWARFAGRRSLRSLGRLAFRSARAMQQRGERVLCLMKDGRPQGLFGFRRHELVPTAATAPASGPVPAPSWHAIDRLQLFDALGANSHGLTAAQAQARLTALGPNRLQARPEPSVARLLLRQFREPMVLILLGAAALSFMLGERVDAVAIVSIVVVNAILAVVQQCKTRQALQSLQGMTAATARALRDGELVVIPADRLVPGDILGLESGDRVPADLRVLEAANLLAEEAALTGESGDVAKVAGAPVAADTALGDRCNMLYAGTFIRSGRGRGLVVATGMNTEMGRIAGLLQGAAPGPTPLQRRLAQLNRVLVVGALLVSAALVAVGLARGLPAGQVLITAISTAVAAIPEGLPIAVTIALAVAVYRMGRRRAVVRHLPAVETLGATMTICTDKTGTLTCNQMTVREVWPGGLEGDQAAVLHMAAVCSNATVRKQPDGTWSGDGDPTEVAILAAAARAGVAREHLTERHTRLHEVPFSAALRCMAVACRDEDGQVHVHTKGAPDKVLGACTRWRRQGIIKPLTEADRALIETQAEAMAGGALRVLAVAYKPLAADWQPGSDEPLQEDLIFAGLLGLMDPPRPEVRDALDRCRRAGVRVLMVTGDHPRTALAVARELGLAKDGDRAITGAEIERLSEAELAATLEGATVCARVAPEQKLRVVRALRAQRQVVAMTGDGVNDAPAIREADIGIAMGRTGTEVTRAAADMVLMDDNFATIIGAIEEGRGTYDNIRRTVRYTLATNIAEVVLMLGAVLLGVPLPLLPVQLLWVNLVCDGVPALSLAFDRPASQCMERPPRRADEGLFAGGLWARMTARGAALGAGTLLLFGALLGATGNLALARSAALATLITSKLLYLLEVRRDEVGRRGLSPNPVLAGAIALSAALFVATLYVPALRPFFKTVAIGAREWLGAAAVTVAGALLERLVSSKQEDPENPGPLLLSVGELIHQAPRRQSMFDRFQGHRDHGGGGRGCSGCRSTCPAPRGSSGGRPGAEGRSAYHEAGVLPGLGHNRLEPLTKLLPPVNDLPAKPGHQQHRRSHAHADSQPCPTDRFQHRPFPETTQHSISSSAIRVCAPPPG